MRLQRHVVALETRRSKLLVCEGCGALGNIASHHEELLLVSVPIFFNNRLVKIMEKRACVGRLDLFHRRQVVSSVEFLFFLFVKGFIRGIRYIFYPDSFQIVFS